MKLDINKLYLCAIYLKTEKESKLVQLGDDIRLKTNYEGKFVKYAIVYNDSYKQYPSFTDAISNEKYVCFALSDAEVGGLYISSKKGLYPISKLLKEMYGDDKQSLPKRKVKKRSAELLNVFEDRLKAKEKDNI